ncbi:hypothetical protein FRC03_006341 [Tulasnella sp. 419]|nr:hypothetical protein FRC03_006341 [Tulasnella sp. 419]
MDVEFQQCDLGSLRETKEVADSIREREERLDLLVCDAGIGATSYALTSDGIEDDFGVNVLGHFLLVNRLLPLMRKTARLPNSDPPRIVSVASSLHQIAPSSTKFASIEEINDPNLRPDAYYDRSKLAIILMTKFGYAQRVIGDKIFALSTHPAAVETGMQDHFKDSYGPILGRMIKTLQYPFMRTPDQGSLSTLWAATSPEIVEKNLQGVYIQDPGRVGGETKQAQDPELADNLWNLNNALVVSKLGQDGLLPWDEVKQ